MITDDAATDLRDLAREFLELQQARHERARIHRPYFAKLAQQYGLTNREIGETYGITESAVRALIQRAGK